MTNRLLPTIESKNLVLKYLCRNEAGMALDYFQKNRERLAKSMPRYSNDFFSLLNFQKRLSRNVKEFEDGSSVRFFLLKKHSSEVIGTCNFTDFIRGIYQGCFLGYGIDEKHEGKGYMTEALSTAINYVFTTTNLHKINANYMPGNLSSGRVLKKLGFEEVGLAKKELYLSGRWQDHVETRLINPNWKNKFEY